MGCPVSGCSPIDGGVTLDPASISIITTRNSGNVFFVTDIAEYNLRMSFPFSAVLLSRMDPLPG